MVFSAGVDLVRYERRVVEVETDFARTVLQVKECQSKMPDTGNSAHDLLLGSLERTRLFRTDLSCTRVCSLAHTRSCSHWDQVGCGPDSPCAKQILRFAVHRKNIALAARHRGYLAI